MATLIQSKQIQGIVTASVVQGDFTVSGDISASRFVGVNYDDIIGTPTFNAGTGISITQVGDTITITNTGGGGGVSGSAELINSVALLNAYTASNDIIINGINQTTASLQSQINALVSATSSYITTDNTGSDNQTLSIVGDQLTISGGNTVTLPSGSGGTSDFTQLTNVPSGLVSSSAQTIANLGGSGILSGSHTDITSLNQFTQSADQRLTSLESFTASLDSTYATDSEVSSLSSSIATTIDNIQHTQIPSGTISGSSQVDVTQTSGYNTFSSSLDSRLSSLENQTDNTGSDSQTLSIVGDQLTIDGGNTVTIPTGSDLPSGIISSSQQISDLGYVTSSLEAPFNGDRVVSNTLLGELYSQSFNAGTTGSLTEFIEQVFFPTQAPTATFTNQTANFNTNLATNNTNLVSVSLTDTVDNSPYTLVLSGTNASSLSAVPTNSESSSWEIRANGNLTAGTYSYDVTVGDSTNAERTYSGRSITIAQADTGTLSTNGTLYIIESAVSGVITLSSSGIPGSTGGVSVTYSPNYGSQSATNFSSSNPLISVNSTNGQLSLGSPISGSGNLAGSTITSTISYEDQYGNQGSGDISVNVTENTAPNVSQTLVTNNNTNQATGSSQVLRLTITDTEGDTIPNSGLSFSGYNTTYFTPSVSTPYMYLNVNNTSVPTGTYPYTASLTDEHGFRTREVNGTFTINQADDGTLSGDTSIYIIESAVSGDSFRDATGYNNGDLANISVSYSPNYGSQVATLASSNPAIVVDESGNLTLGVDLSGSVTQSGDTFSSTISWSDQYGNTDSGTVTATVFANQAPNASFVDNGLTDVTAVSGSNVGTLTVTDTENNSPFVVTLGGTDGGKFDVSGTSSPFQIQPTGSLSIGDYSIQLTVTDTYGKQAILNETISVTADVDYGKVYIYTSTRVGDGTFSNYLGLMGASSVDSSTPPLVTAYTADTTSPFFRIKSGDLGNSTITVGGGQMNLRSEVSGSDLNTIISSSFSAGGVSEQILVVFPSGSDMIGTPTSMTDTLGGSTNGEYVMFVKGGADTSFGSETSTIHGIQLDTAHEGYSTWYVVGRTGINADNSYEVQIIPSSGSAPV